MIQIFPTPDALAGAVAGHVAECAKAAIAAHGRFILTLSGGSTPRAAYERLANNESRVTSRETRVARDDWHGFHVFWSDERCVPPDDPRSNYRMAKETLLDKVPIPEDQIHRIHGEDDPERAARDYERELRALLSEDPSLALRMREGALRMRGGALGAGLDLVLLGLGNDGHTASLFPGQRSVQETERWVMAVPAGDGAVWRVTLTPAILNAAHNVTFVVSGSDKAAPLQQVIEGPFAPDRLPAQAIRPREGRLTWMVDEAAAARLRASPASA